MATTAVQRMTLEDLRALPEGPPYYEYEEGELILVASPTPEHQDIVGVDGHLDAGVIKFSNWMCFEAIDAPKHHIRGWTDIQADMVIGQHPHHRR